MFPYDVLTGPYYGGPDWWVFITLGVLLLVAIVAVVVVVLRKKKR